MASTVVFGVSFVDIKGFPFGKYDPRGRNLGTVQIVHGGVSRNVAEAEQSLQAVERIREYSDVEPEENPNIPKCEVDESWPQTGTIEFENVSARYRPFVVYFKKTIISTF